MGLHYGPLDPRAGLTWFEFLGTMILLIILLVFGAIILSELG